MTKLPRSLQQLVGVVRLSHRRGVTVSAQRVSSNPCVRFALFLSILGAPFWGPQQAARGGGASRTPFAQYVPAAAELFVATPNVGELGVTLNKTHAWDLLTLLAGGPPAAGRDFSMITAIKTLVGCSQKIAPAEIRDREMGVVAKSWLAVGGAVWLIRVADEAMVDRWYPVRNRTKVGTDGQAHFFQSRNKVFVCIRDDVLAVARSWGPGTVMDRVIELMAGRSTRALAQSPEFRGLRTYLPDGGLGTVYVARAASDDASQVPSSPFWPSIDRAAIHLSEGAGRIDVAIRASLAAPHRKQKLGAQAIDRLMRLPQTTLFGSVTTVDWSRALETAPAGTTSGTMARYLTLLTALRSSAGATESAEHQLGPHTIVAWDQDLRGDTDTPQLAVMIECSNERAVRNQARDVAGRIIQLLGWMEPAVSNKPIVVETTTHLGVDIEYVSLENYAASSRLSFAKLMRNTDPAWAVWNGWLIVAMGRDHLERILDAQLGLLPTLADVRDAQPLLDRASNRAVLSVIQADLATKTLDRWVADAEGGSASLLSADWWSASSMTASTGRVPLGIKMSADSPDGVVIVEGVATRSAAAGRLESQDRILGVDGQVLSLKSPDADLRRRLTASRVEPGPTLRVERDGKALDVVLPRSQQEALRANLRTRPVDAVRELASLGRTLQCSTFTVNETDEMHFSARLSLRFRAQPSVAATKSGKQRTPSGK